MQLSRFNNKDNNKESSKTIALVVSGFLAVVLSIFTYVSVYNLQMNAKEVKKDNSFYSAEMALDEIKAGLEIRVSGAVFASYMDVMQNYSSYSDEERVSRFRNLFFSSLTDGRSGLGGEKADTYSLPLLQSFLTRSADVARVSSDAPDMLIYKDRLVLDNVRVTYNSPDSDNVSVIQTDINLMLPDMDFGRQLVLPGMADYSLIAGKGIVVRGTGTRISDSRIFAGTRDKDTSSLTLGRDRDKTACAGITFSNCEYIVTEGTIDIEGSDSYFETDEKSSLWTRGIVVGSGMSKGQGASHPYNLRLDGSSYVEDDLTVKGNLSGVYLGGSYFGYGHGGGLTEDSSAILLNGYHTTLDFRNLTQLVMAGNACIGLGGNRFDVYGNAADASKGTNLLENGNVRMGESMATKAHQIAYLVPPECIGWTRGTSGESEDCIIGKNPVSQAEYNRYLNSYAGGSALSDSINEVDLDQTIEFLGKKLSDYGLDKDNPYYVVIPQGSQWRYYYLNFASEKDAGNFFRDYYAADFARMDKYIDNYLDKFSYNTALMTSGKNSGNLRLNLAGNTFYPNPEHTDSSTPAYRMVPPDESTATAQLKLGAEYDMYARTYDSLCRILSVNYGIMSDEQAGRDVFHNLISEENWNSIMSGTTSHLTFCDRDQVERVYVSRTVHGKDGDDTSLMLSDVPDTVDLIITDQDVVIDRGFSGTLLTEGMITISEGGYEITGNAGKVSECLNLTMKLPVNVRLGSSDTNLISVANFFNEGADITAVSMEGDDSAGLPSTVPADRLVTFSDWKRK
jgi:hypothetical protein